MIKTPLRSWALALLALVMAGCPGVGGGVSCTRYPDGRIECSVEAHNSGNHDAPVK